MISAGDIQVARKHNGHHIHIFKIQLPITSSEEYPPALVYTRGKAIVGEVIIDEDLKKLFPPGVNKVFAEGTYIDGMVSLCGTLWPDPDAFDW